MANRGSDALISAAMSTAGDVGASNCPGCGAPADDGIAGPAGGLRCAYCGAVLRRPGPAPPTMALPRVPPTRPTPAKRVLIIYAAVVGAAVVFGAIMNLRVGRRAGVRQVLQSIPSMQNLGVPANSTRVGELLAVFPNGGSTDALVALDGDGHAVGLFDGRKHTLRWRAGAFSKAPGPTAVTFDSQRVVVVEDSRVTALSLKDGASLWQASLLTELNAGCSDCLRALKERVVALQKDGTLQAFDAATGQVVWSLKLESQPRRLFAVGGHLIVERIVQGRKAQADIDVVDPADGSTIRTMRPSCINSAFHRPERPNDGTPLLFDEAGQSMYTIFGFFSYCAQAWDVATGQRRWNTYVPEWNTTGHAVLGARALMFDDRDDGVTALDLATGKPRRLAADKEYTIRPLYGQGDEVVVKAAPHWDSNRVALWGLDAATGNKRWQFPLSAQHLSLDTLLDTWSWRRTPAGLVVLQQLPDDTVSLDVVNPATGVSTGRKIFPGRGFSRYVMRDELAWIPTRSGYDAIGLPGGQVAYHLGP